jgi:hypothetical protein
MKKLLFVIAIFTVFSCSKVKDKAGETIDSGAQVVGKTATDIVNNIDKGISEGMALNIQMSDALKKAGLSFGKYYVRNDSLGNENTISMYLITDKELDADLHLKLFDKKGVEMGRTEKHISQKKGQAAYHDFVFDEKIEFESKSKLIIE